jgi:hypothetical protein
MWQLGFQHHKFPQFDFMSFAKRNKLNRFTTLPVLLDMLTKKRLTFSDPKFWDDENDTELLEIYRKKKNVNTLLALCFLEDYETIHHWKTFAGGINGCCIEFDKVMLTKLFSDHKSDSVKFGSVVYKKIECSEDGAIDDCEDMIPFKKRWPYRFEKEFRAIWCGREDNYAILNIDLAMITRITISQLMPNARFEKIKKNLSNVVAGKTEINQSTVYRNEEKWIDVFKKKFANHRG